MAVRRSPLAPALLAALILGLLFGPETFVPTGLLEKQEQVRPVAWGLQGRAGDRGAAVQTHALGNVVEEAEAASLVATPKEAYFTMVDKGEYNAKMPIWKIFHQSMMGGAFIGFGGLLSLSIAGNMPGAELNNPGLGKLIFGALFPVNLLLVLLTGAQLYTGNTATVSAALIEGRATLPQLAKTWVVSMFGNIVSCFIFALATKYCGFLADGTKNLAVELCIKKTSASFGHALVKAIGANWLVCMAVFLSGQARDMAGKMVGIWFPISTFVAIGMEHSVANMFLLPAGILAGAPVTWSQMVLKNWIPVCLGNAIAGAFFVAASFSFSYGKLSGH